MFLPAVRVLELTVIAKIFLTCRQCAISVYAV